jgi:stage II sporulation protein D
VNCPDAERRADNLRRSFSSWPLAIAVCLMTTTTCAAPAPAPTPAKSVRPPTTGPAREVTQPSGRPPGRPPKRPSERDVRNVGDAPIRVLISRGGPIVRIASPGGVMFTTLDGSFIARAAQREVWRIEHEGRRLRAIRPDGVATDWIAPALVARPIGNSLLSFGDKPYRGDFAFYGGDTGVLVVNDVSVDDYLRGVVPLEIGTEAAADSAAIQAQAVAARSYAYTHLTTEPARTYDLTDRVTDQVYGGVAVETAVASEAVETTRTLLLKYNGRVVNAPYHSTCGGATAAASEVWRSGDEPYLRSVSDRIPGTERYYCDGAPRFRWTRTLDGAMVNAALARYLAAFTSVPGNGPGIAHDVGVTARTASGRVAAITITTNRGNFVVRGNDIRYVLRQPGGAVLNSTDFSATIDRGRDGAIALLTLRGKGYGHGVGMCQSGAIGRARSGQDFRTILQTYYPGTAVGPAE